MTSPLDRNPMTSPLDFGAPPQFSRWYPLQQGAFEWALSQPIQHIGLAMPTGSGKSVVAYLLAKTFGLRTVILTSRIGLAHQYTAAFGGGHDPSVAEVHGWRNYRTLGDYRAALGTALSQDTRIAVTNYAYYLHADFRHKYGATIVVCDEAAAVFGELGGYLSVHLDRYWIERRLKRPCWPPNPTEDPEDWREWAGDTAKALEHMAEELAWPSAEWDEVRGLIGGLERLRDHDGHWVGTTGEGRAFFAKVWPGEDTERLLVRGAEKVIWLSATLRPKTFDLLHIPAGGRALWDAHKHPYPWEHRPVYWIPTIRAVETRATQLEWDYWVERLDQLIRRSPGALGLIHTVSYRRAQMYLTRSEFSGTNILTTHGAKAGSALAAIKEWLEGPRPRVMVSPALMTGWDFGAVSWQALGKLPWPDSRDVVLRARAETDRDFGAYETMQAVVQSAGRICRGPSRQDRGETFIVDDSWAWFGPKYREFAPRWWWVEKTDRPPPLVAI